MLYDNNTLIYKHVDIINVNNSDTNYNIINIIMTKNHE